MDAVATSAVEPLTATGQAVLLASICFITLVVLQVLNCFRVACGFTFAVCVVACTCELLALVYIFALADTAEPIVQRALLSVWHHALASSGIYFADEAAVARENLQHVVSDIAKHLPLLADADFSSDSARTALLVLGPSWQFDPVLKVWSVLKSINCSITFATTTQSTATVPALDINSTWSFQASSSLLESSAFKDTTNVADADLSAFNAVVWFGRPSSHPNETLSSLMGTVMSAAHPPAIIAGTGINTTVLLNILTEHALLGPMVNASANSQSSNCFVQANPAENIARDTMNDASALSSTMSKWSRNVASCLIAAATDVSNVFRGHFQVAKPSDQQAVPSWGQTLADAWNSTSQVVTCFHNHGDSVPPTETVDHVEKLARPAWSSSTTHCLGSAASAHTLPDSTGQRRDHSGLDLVQNSLAVFVRSEFHGVQAENGDEDRPPSILDVQTFCAQSCWAQMLTTANFSFHKHMGTISQQCLAVFTPTTTVADAAVTFARHCRPAVSPYSGVARANAFIGNAINPTNDTDKARATETNWHRVTLLTARSSDIDSFLLAFAVASEILSRNVAAPENNGGVNGAPFSSIEEAKAAMASIAATAATEAWDSCKADVAAADAAAEAALAEATACEQRAQHLGRTAAMASEQLADMAQQLAKVEDDKKIHEEYCKRQVSEQKATLASALEDAEAAAAQALQELEDSLTAAHAAVVANMTAAAAASSPTQAVKDHVEAAANVSLATFCNCSKNRDTTAPPTTDEQATIAELTGKVADLQLENGRLQSERSCLACDELAESLEAKESELRRVEMELEHIQAVQSDDNQSACNQAAKALNDSVLLFTVPLRTAADDDAVHYMPVYQWCLGAENDCAEVFLKAHNDVFGFTADHLQENAALIGEAIRSRLKQESDTTSV